MPVKQLLALADAYAAALAEYGIYQTADRLSDASHKRIALENALALAQGVVATPEETHPDAIIDNAAIDRFAAVMKAKMATSRAKGRGGWNDKTRCTQETLQQMLIEHLGKGDPTDIGIFAMMLSNRGEQTCVARGSTHPVLFDQYTGQPRDPRDIASDPEGKLIVPQFTELRAYQPQPVWLPINTAPTDNKRLLYLARFDSSGNLTALDFNGTWEYWQESYEMPHVWGYCWMSENDIDDPTHWAYQDEPIPPVTRLEDHEIAKLVNDLRDIAITYAGTQQLRQAISMRVAPAVQPVPRNLLVTSIMLDVVPGEGGMGTEVYAKSADDVVQRLTELDEKLEEWELGIRRRPDPSTLLDSDEACTTIYKTANNEVGKLHPITTQRIFKAMRAVEKQVRLAFGAKT